MRNQVRCILFRSDLIGIGGDDGDRNLARPRPRDGCSPTDVFVSDVGDSKIKKTLKMR